eukprot:14004444-Alexandrium_andersonii.AAC.1
MATEGYFHSCRDGVAVRTAVPKILGKVLPTFPTGLSNGTQPANTSGRGRPDAMYSQWNLSLIHISEPTRLALI